MKTKSIWGPPPTRLYNIARKIESEKKFFDVCIVGCSDGKFVMPFVRKKHNVTCFDIDNIALYGGYKHFPIKREKINKITYTADNSEIIGNKIYSSEIPTERKEVLGLTKRLDMEDLDEYAEVRNADFFDTKIDKKFDLVFTSCSIHYKRNGKYTLEYIMNKFKSAVKEDGYLYMDYMMTLRDNSEEESELHLRAGQINKFFQNDSWKIIYCREMSKPVFEAAHVDCVYDHFHRFGYILAKRV